MANSEFMLGPKSHRCGQPLLAEYFCKIYCKQVRYLHQRKIFHLPLCRIYFRKLSFLWNYNRIFLFAKVYWDCWM